MEMTYTREQFNQKAEKGPDGKWWWPGAIEHMERWARERSAYNGHQEVETIIDSKFERALYCNRCRRWASMSSLKDEFGIFGPVVYERCIGGTDEKE